MLKKSRKRVNQNLLDFLLGDLVIEKIRFQ